MTINWENIIARLQTYPAGTHRFRPPCPDMRIEVIQKQLGKLPTVLMDMLTLFNGARLFNKCGEMVALFGISEEPPLPPPEWCVDWYIDKFTPQWRSAKGTDREHDWAIAMMNYGGLILLNDEGIIKEFDRSQQKLTSRLSTFEGWIEEILREGDKFMNEE